MKIFNWSIYWSIGWIGKVPKTFLLVWGAKTLTPSPENSIRGGMHKIVTLLLVVLLFFLINNIINYYFIFITLHLYPKISSFKDKIVPKCQ